VRQKYTSACSAVSSSARMLAICATAGTTPPWCANPKKPAASALVADHAASVAGEAAKRAAAPSAAAAAAAAGSSGSRNRGSWCGAKDRQSNGTNSAKSSAARVAFAEDTAEDTASTFDFFSFLESVAAREKEKKPASARDQDLYAAIANGPKSIGKLTMTCVSRGCMPCVSKLS